MSDYTTEADGSVRARRRRRSLITLAIVLVGLFFAFWYAWSYYRADTTARATRPPPATCAPYDAKAVTPARTKVNVYNASDRTGLASSVSKALAERGFVIGKVANDPSGRKDTAVAEVRHGPGGVAQAKLVMTATPKGTKLVNDNRKGATVDVAVGAAFTRLTPVPTATGLPMCQAPSETP